MMENSHVLVYALRAARESHLLKGRRLIEGCVLLESFCLPLADDQDILDSFNHIQVEFSLHAVIDTFEFYQFLSQDILITAIVELHDFFCDLVDSLFEKDEFLSVCLSV